MKDSVLVLGGAGYIGGPAVDLPSRCDCEQNVYDVLMYERDYRKPVSFTYGDLLDTSRLETTIREFQPTAIIWLAAIAGDGACQVNAEARLLVDQQLVEWLAANYAGRIVFTSTCSVSPMTPKPSIEFSDVSFEDARNYRVDASKYTAQPGAVPFKITLEDFEFSVERL